MDGRLLGSAAGMGVATYARHLRAAQQLIGNDAVIDSVPMFGGRATRWTRALWPGARAARATSTGFGVPDLFRLAQVFFDVHRSLLPIRAAGPPGIVHWSYPLPLRLLGWRNLYTVHDAIPLRCPELSSVSATRHRRLLRAILRSPAELVTVSRAARDEIAGQLPGATARLHECGQAVTMERGCAPLPAGIVADGYLLVCGTVEQRKNVAAILAAYRAAGLRLPLVIAGPGGSDRELEQAIAAAPGVIRLPLVERPVLRSLLTHARALVMPSLAEGFGLPVVEAMALGTAVLTSAGGALGEVAGGAALTVDPRDPVGLTAAVKRIAEDAPLRARLVAAGRVNASRFTLERFAARLRDVYTAPPIGQHADDAYLK